MKESTIFFQNLNFERAYANALTLCQFLPFNFQSNIYQLVVVLI